MLTVLVLQSCPKSLEQKFAKNNHKASLASHTKIFSIRCSCINTMQFLYFVNWYCFGTMCIQMFGLLSSGVDIKGASFEQEAASAVASVDT